MCLVVSAELGVEAQTRDCIQMAVKHGVSSAVVFVSKVDAVAESERDAVVATIVDSIEEQFNQHGIDFDASKSVSGSALLALKKTSRPLVYRQWSNWVDKSASSVAPIQISHTVSLKKYAEFRRKYHQDAIKSDVLHKIQPRYQYKRL